MLTATELNRSSIMADLDYNAILGKRLKLTLISPFNLVLTGVCVGFVATALSYPQFKTDGILFLEDGFDEPDFIDFDFLELIE